MGSQQLTRGDAADQNPKPAVFSPGDPRQTVTGRLSDRKKTALAEGPGCAQCHPALLNFILLCSALLCPARLFSDRHSSLLPALPGANLLSATEPSPAAIALSYRSANAEHGKTSPALVSYYHGIRSVCSTISQSRLNRTALLEILIPEETCPAAVKAKQRESKQNWQELLGSGNWLSESRITI